MYDNRVASDYAIDKMKLLLKKNGETVPVTIRLFKLIYKTPGGAYGIKDFSKLTEEENEKNELLESLANKVESEFRQAYHDIAVSPENSITRDYARRILQLGTPGGESHGQLLNRFGARHFLPTVEYYALLQDIVKDIETFELEE